MLLRSSRPTKYVGPYQTGGSLDQVEVTLNHQLRGLSQPPQFNYTNGFVHIKRRFVYSVNFSFKHNFPILLDFDLPIYLIEMTPIPPFREFASFVHSSFSLFIRSGPGAPLSSLDSSEDK